MKLTELKPCALCGGPIAPVFYCVSVEQVMVDYDAAQTALGLNALFGGRAPLKMVETFMPVDSVTTVLNKNTALVCSGCARSTQLDVITLGEATDE